MKREGRSKITGLILAVITKEHDCEDEVKNEER
jgi:hypothetical protein